MVPAWTLTGLLCLVLPLGVSCSASGPKEIAAFRTDGCTLYPERERCDGKDWGLCCLEHDIAYWRGGTKEERRRADEALRACVLQVTGSRTRAKTMYWGVRIGGSPYLPTCFRWGYGWKYGRGYRALTVEEEAMARARLKDYFDCSSDDPHQGELGRPVHGSP